MKKFVMSLTVVLSLALAQADVYIINGERVEGEVHEINGQLTICTDELCMILPADAVRVPDAKSPAEPAARPPQGGDAAPAPTARLTQGYLKPDELISFLRGGGAGEADGRWDDAPVWMVLWLALLGGLLMNLTPCVLPMVPINLMIIGKSAARGALYGLGIAIAHGILGVLAAVGGMAFGEIQGNPWFNVAIAAVFLALGLSMLGVFFIDFSKGRSGFAQKKSTMMPGLFAFFMGMVSAVLAGACVAPILIAVLLLTARLYAGGNVFALGLPFVLGLGMGLPWPFAGAGLKVLPKPGAWMPYVNKAFGILVLGFAGWYGYLAYQGFRPRFSAAETSQPADSLSVTPSTFSLEGLRRPVFVDCWATWCKNCTAMEKTTFLDPSVVTELKGFTVIRLQAEDISELRRLPGFGEVKGLPAFAVFE